MSALLQTIEAASNGGIFAIVGTAAPDYYANGLPFVDSGGQGALAVDGTSAIASYHQGLPFTANGRLATSDGALAGYGGGAAPFLASGRLLLEPVDAPDLYMHGVPYASGGVSYAITL